jgi:hypothetical protein
VITGITSLIIGGTLVLISLNTNSIGGLIPLSTGQIEKGWPQEIFSLHIL